MVNWHKFFTSILDTISDGVFISDAMGTTLYVNQMYADLVGVPARDLRGKNVRDLVSEGFFDLALKPRSGAYGQARHLYAEAQGRQERGHFRLARF